MSQQLTPPREAIAAEAFWSTHCSDCTHPLHGADQRPGSYDVRCGEIVGSDGAPMPTPEYCACLDWREVVKAVERIRPTAQQLHEDGQPHPDPLTAESCRRLNYGLCRRVLDRVAVAVEHYATSRGTLIERASR